MRGPLHVLTHPYDAGEVPARSRSDGIRPVLAGPPPVLTSTVEEVIGVPPRSLRQWVADHIDDFR